MPRHAKRTVLVIDDDESAGDLFVRVIEKAGGRAFVERDPIAALSVWVSDQRIDAVLADFNLEHTLTGIEILSQWAEARPEARRVLVTAHPKDSTLIEALASGVVEQLLEKPPRLADLREALGLTSGPAAFR